MKGRPLISVITVTYNSGSYVRDAIESVLAQTYQEFEYIILDDCSTDATWSIIKEYKDERITAERNSSNFGEYRNRNQGIAKAKGKYLIFIDGDDYIYPHGLENYIQFAESFPEAAMVIQKGYINNLIFPALLQPEQVIRNTFFGKECLLTSSFASDLFRTDRLRELGSLSENYQTGDEEVRLRIALSYPILFIPGWFSWPRETPGQASSKLLHGIGLAEAVSFAGKLLPNSNNIRHEVALDILSFLKRNLARQVLRNYLHGRFALNRRIFKIAGSGFTDLVGYVNYIPRFKDPMAEYSPAAPFKVTSSIKSDERKDSVYSA